MQYGRMQERCEEIARYIIDNEATVRTAAVIFAVSKSTVHKDITHQLYKINRSLYEEVKKILDKNKSERHIRGGEATRRKYMQNKEFT